MVKLTLLTSKKLLLAASLTLTLHRLDGVLGIVQEYVFKLGVAAMIVIQEIPLSIEYSILTLALLSVVLVYVMFVELAT